MKILLLGFVVVVLGFAAFVRLRPFVPVAVTQKFDEDTDLTGGYVAVRPFAGDGADVLARITQVALKTPRTTLVQQTPLTFVTRSRGFGFPDVTQIWVEDGTLTVHAHLVYGKADLGVNKARVLAWLDALGPL